MNAPEVSNQPPGGFSLEQAARDQVSRWSDICQEFLDWENRQILRVPDPSAESIERHRVELKWLLRFGRAIYLTACDPDYPDKQIRTELNGRLIQLEHSWRIVHEQLPASEAQQVLPGSLSAMNPDLEALIVALDAVIQARGGDDLEKLDAVYQARLD